jgi:hypothetical protein
VVDHQRIDPDLAEAARRIAVRPADLEGDTVAAVAGQEEAGLRGRTEELPRRRKTESVLYSKLSTRRTSCL